MLAMTNAYVQRVMEMQMSLLPSVAGHSTQAPGDLAPTQTDLRAILNCVVRF